MVNWYMTVLFCFRKFKCVLHGLKYVAWTGIDVYSEGRLLYSNTVSDHHALPLSLSVISSYLVYVRDS